MFNLQFEVHCNRPQWSYDSGAKNYTIPAYRLYCQDELLVERAWVWGENNFIFENVWLKIERRKIYTLKLEQVAFDKEAVQFYFKNVTCSDAQLFVHRDESSSISFVIN